MAGEKEDDQYKKATKPLIDDAMRTDILGPKLVKVLKDHKPADDLVKSIIADAISNNSKVRSQLSKFIATDTTTKRNKWIDRVVTAVLTLIAAGFIQFILSRFSDTS